MQLAQQSSPARPHEARDFRPDIEGLRAVSILTVLTYHYFPSLLGGGYVGVDVFFVISGYLITRSLIGAHRPGIGLGPWLAGFYARRVRRLLPNALLMLLVVATLGFTLLSDFAIKRLGSDVMSAALYAVNWLFVLRSMDYLQWDEARSSIVLNYWSLAVEEQFYIIWPLLLFGLLAVAARSGATWRNARWSTLLLLLLSLAYCLWLGRSNLTTAFFSTPARAWELLIGAWLALRGSATRPEGLAPMRAWHETASGVGLLAIVIAAAVFSDASAHPGIMTLIPVLGAAAVVACGASGGPAARILQLAPLQWLGSRSYSIYLWHWPVLMLGKALLPRGSVVGPLLLLAAGLVLAEAAYRWVEEPARFRRATTLSAARVLHLAVLGSLLVAAVGVGLRAAGAASARELMAMRPAERAVPRAVPELQRVQQDLPRIYALGCHLGVEAIDSPECLFGATGAGRSVVLFGDSIAAQWFPALDEVALALGVRLYSRTKSSCPSADVTVWNQVAKGVYANCDIWRETVFKQIEQSRPGIVFVSNLVDESVVLVDRRSGNPVRGREALSLWSGGLAQSVERLQRSGARVVILRDPPKPRPDILDCLYSAAAVQKCELTWAEATAAPALDAAVAKRTGATLWDLGDSVCPAGTCPVVLPGTRLVVYRDKAHLTASFASTLAPAIRRRWEALNQTQGPPRPAGR